MDIERTKLNLSASVATAESICEAYFEYVADNPYDAKKPRTPTIPELCWYIGIELAEFKEIRDKLPDECASNKIHVLAPLFKRLSARIHAVTTSHQSNGIGHATGHAMQLNEQFHYGRKESSLMIDVTASISGDIRKKLLNAKKPDKILDARVIDDAPKAKKVPKKPRK